MPGLYPQATAAAILGANCKPVIVDVDASSGIVTPDALEAGFLKSGARAAIVLAPYGITTDFHAHEAICRKMGKLLIIDNASGLGVLRGQSSFSGDEGVVREVYSLHATKPFGVGEGCAIFAPQPKIPSLRAAMNFGLQTHSATGCRQPPYWGINGKMSEFHAAIGLAVADGMPHRVVARQKMAANWVARLQNSPAQLFSTAIESSPWQVFPVLLETEADVLATVAIAAELGIELRRYYTPSLGACRGMDQITPCPNAQSLSERALVLPIRSTMTGTDQAELMDTVRHCIVKAQRGGRE